VLALLLSLLVHALLATLAFEGAGGGLPGFGLPWRERRIEAPELHVLLDPTRATGSETASAATGEPSPSSEPLVRTRPTATPPALPALPRELRVSVRPEASPSTDSPGADAGASATPAKAAARSDGGALAAPKLAATSPSIAAAAAPAAAPAAQPEPAAPTPVILSTLAEPPARPPAPSEAPEAASAPTVVAALTDSGVAAREEVRLETLRREAERREAERREAERQEAQVREAQRQEAARLESERVEAQRQAASRLEAQREAQRQETERLAAAQLATEQREAQRREAARLEAERIEAARRESERREALRRETERQAAERVAAEQRVAQQQEAARQEAARQEASRLESSRQEAARREAAAQESARLRAKQEEEERREARLRAIGRQLDEEAARREPSAADARRPWTLPQSLSTARRARLWGRVDSNLELVRYAEAWALKIQLNTPVETVREVVRRPHTQPVVTVAIRSDGSVESVSFVRSSSVAEVDEAVRRIVQSHAHYPVFPPELARDYDVVEIRRTWHFDTAVRLN
jgi:TonB family protein